MKFQKGLLGILRDIYQIDAFRSPVHVELSESTETERTFKKDCALQGNISLSATELRRLDFPLIPDHLP